MFVQFSFVPKSVEIKVKKEKFGVKTEREEEIVGNKAGRTELLVLVARKEMDWVAGCTSER